MVFLQGHDLEQAYADVLSGRKALIGWGCIALFPYYYLNSPLIPERMVDADPQKWGRRLCGLPIIRPQDLSSLDPEKIVVMVYPDYDPKVVSQIQRQLEELGGFSAVPPFRAQINLGQLERQLAPYRHSGTALLHGRVRLAIERADLLADLTPKDLVRSIREARATIPTPPPTVRKRARLFIGRLQPGGAERQLTYLAQGLAARGWDAGIRTFAPPLAGAEGYLAGLEQSGFEHRVLPSVRDVFSPEQTPDGLPLDIEAIAPVLRRLPMDLVHYVAMAYRELIRDRPELVVSYLDIFNIGVGIAALLAGIPHVLVSGRNLNPTHFPNHYAFAEGWIKPCYEAILCFPEVHLTANSAAGAASYQEWLGLPREQVTAIPNGLLEGALPPLAEGERERIRREIGVPLNAPMIVGVFRLADEKRPFLFLDAAQLVAAAAPDVHVVLVGDGPLRDDIVTAGRRLVDEGRLHMTGARSDATDIIAAGDLILHTAWAEGHPNVLMEAQLLGRSIICTASHGTAECLCPSTAIRIVESDAPECLAAASLTLLQDREAATAAASPARAWLFDHFSIAKLVENTLTAAGLPADRIAD